MQDVIIKLQELWFSNKERYLKAEKAVKETKVSLPNF